MQCLTYNTSLKEKLLIQRSTIEKKFKQQKLISFEIASQFQKEHNILGKVNKNRVDSINSLH